MFTTFASMSGHQFMCDICFETHSDPHHYCEEMRYDDRFADPQQIESNFIDMFVSVSGFGNTKIGGKLMWISNSGFKDHAEAEAAMAESDVVSPWPCGHDHPYIGEDLGYGRILEPHAESPSGYAWIPAEDVPF